MIAKTDQPPQLTANETAHYWRAQAQLFEAIIKDDLMPIIEAARAYVGDPGGFRFTLLAERVHRMEKGLEITWPECSLRPPITDAT